MAFKINMASVSFMFIFVCLSWFVNSEVQVSNEGNLYENHDSEIAAVLKRLNSSSFRVYNYKEATLLHAHIKADISELVLEVDVECLNNYPELPCTEKTLICHAFVQNTPDNGSQVLNDVNCKPKPEIIVDELPMNLTDAEINETKSIVLSHETASSEVSDPFIAVHKDRAPCLGCPFDLDPNVEGVDELVELSLEHVNSERTHKQSLVKVVRLQQQVVSGVKYILTVELRPTLCLKESPQDVNLCPMNYEVDGAICEITYLQKPWISKAKHIIGNNCTVSQEYVKSDGKKDDINNEININDKPTKPAVVVPNFDHIAESGTIDEMTPSRLSDLESQIVLDIEDASPRKNEAQDQEVLSTVLSQMQNDAPTGTDKLATTEVLEVETTSANDATTTIIPGVSQNPEERISSVAFQGPLENTTPFISEKPVEQTAKNTVNLEDSKNSSEENKNSSEEQEKLKKKASSEERKNSSEENTREKRSDESGESSESPSYKSLKQGKDSEESGEDTKARKRRAIPQLEKISPEEKPLVKNLADFAAAALDNIDDDNHRRIILQILGAKKMVGDDGVYYHLIMRMGISRCLEDKPLNPYENCREKLFENYTKICKVQVYVNDDFGSPKVVKSQCQNIKRDKNDSNRTNYSRFRRETLVGGQTEISVNSDKVKNLLNEGIKHFNAQRDGNKFKPVEVLSATSQVVAGRLIRINIKISESDCSKNDEKELEDCNVVAGGVSKECQIKIWEKGWENFRQFTTKCDGDDRVYKVDTKIRRKRQIPGGEFQVDKDDEFLEKYLESSLSHLDAQSDHDNKYKVHKIVSATKQIVAGHIYRIKAKVVLSDCKKTSSTNRRECGRLRKASPKTCDFKVFEQVWVPGSRQLNVTCEDEINSTRHKRRTEAFSVKRDNPNEEVKYSGLLGRDDSKVFFSKFTEFITQYNKKYSKKEFKYRFKIFSENMLKIRVLNAYEQGTATYGVTRFADLTQREFSRSLGLRMDLRNENSLPFAKAQIPDIDIPTEFDWRQKGAVTEVKNQQQCGSCWAFSVTGNVEGQYAIKHNNLLEFSEQELVDCDTEDQGCNGGLMDNAYRQIESLGGLETEQDYPYDAEDEKCHFNRSLARVQLSGAVNISHDESDMAKWLVANGPISIAINANAMQFYFGGVSHPFKFLCNPNNLDHGVLIVGYGVHTYPLFNKTLPYWIVKNSWGTSWGEQGYYRVYRGDGTCGLNQTPSSAIVV